MRRALLLFALALTARTPAAQAAAWTLPSGHWQVFTTTTQSEAKMSFDGHGKQTVPANFSKTLLQNCFEYGLTGGLTVFVIPDYVTAHVQTPPGPLQHVADSSVEAGARLLLDGRHGKLSLQASYKTAGAFDLSVSANRASGRQMELRLLYGTSFKLAGLDGFVDLQAAQRWIARPRPDETPVDLTAGLWLSKRTMLMAQSFNVIGAGDARPPYTYYRSHKLELSLVEKITRHWSLQLGAFYSPAGQNALVERGFTVSLWTQD